jgi:hypothetical protein
MLLGQFIEAGEDKNDELTSGQSVGAVATVTTRRSFRSTPAPRIFFLLTTKFSSCTTFSQAARRPYK